MTGMERSFIDHHIYSGNEVFYGKRTNLLAQYSNNLKCWLKMNWFRRSPAWSPGKPLTSTFLHNLGTLYSSFPRFLWLQYGQFLLYSLVAMSSAMAFHETTPLRNFIKFVVSWPRSSFCFSTLSFIIWPYLGRAFVFYCRHCKDMYCAYILMLSLIEFCRSDYSRRVYVYSTNPDS